MRLRSLLLSGAMLPLTIGLADIAAAESREGLPIILAQASQGSADLTAAQEELKAAQEALRQALTGGGDVEAAKKRLEAALKKLAEAQQAAGATPVPTPPSTDAPAKVETRPAETAPQQQQAQPPAQPSPPAGAPQRPEPPAGAPQPPAAAETPAAPTQSETTQQAEPPAAETQTTAPQQAEPPAEAPQPPAGAPQPPAAETPAAETQTTAPQQAEPPAGAPQPPAGAPQPPAAGQAPAAPTQTETTQQAAPPATQPQAAQPMPQPTEIPVPPDSNVLQQESDRVILKLGDQIIIRKDETQRLRQEATDVQVRDLGNGLTEYTILRPDGSQVITVRDERGNVLRQVRRLPDGTEIVLIDVLDVPRQERPPIIEFERTLPPLVVEIPREKYIVETETASDAEIEEALTAPPVEAVERVYTLEEVRQSERLRDKVRRVDLDTITFEFNKWTIAPDQIDELTQIGRALEGIVAERPGEVFLIEGHTDAVGSNLYNLALSDRRAESVAMALSSNFRIPPENLVTQGYGEQYLKVPTQERERENRRVAIRRITPLVRSEQ